MTANVATVSLSVRQESLNKLACWELLDRMRERGSSIDLSWGEDNNIWECSWITSGTRFTGLASTPLIAIARAAKSGGIK